MPLQRSRIVDDALLEAASAGRTQIVLIGAGLDTHAFRLNWPQPVRLFEVDLPPLFAVKEPILHNAGAAPACERHLIAANVASSDWPDMLVANGFQSDVPTHWVDHALMTLPTATARDGVSAITERGLGQDPRHWIETLGWTTSFKSFAELAASYPRSVEVDADSGHIIATRN